MIMENYIKLLEQLEKLTARVKAEGRPGLVKAFEFIKELALAVDLKADELKTTSCSWMDCHTTGVTGRWLGINSEHHGWYLCPKHGKIWSHLIWESPQTPEHLIRFATEAGFSRASLRKALDRMDRN